MEVTINYNGQAVAVEVTLEVYEFLDRADHKTENLFHEQRRHWDGRAFFDGSEISSEFVGGQCASWRLPPKAAVSTYGRHSFVEGIRNGGLDVTQNRRSTRKIHYGRTKLPALQRFFSFPVLRGRIACLIWFRFVPVRLPLSAVKSSHR